MKTDDEKPIPREYWHHTPIGMPIPGCVAALLDDDYYFAPNRWKRFEHRAFQLPKRHWHLIGFALEAEHRRRPITRLYLLRDALNRMRQPGYDLGPARRLAAVHGQACWATIRGRVADDLNEKRAETELKRAIRQLPSSPADNLALMRAALRMPARAGS